jgi:hypothetical protein
MAAQSHYARVGFGLIICQIQKSLLSKILRSVNPWHPRGTLSPHYSLRPWTRIEEKLLGTDTDAEIGRQLGRDKTTVGERRRQLEISSTLRYWTPEETKLLGTIPDAQVAQRLGRTLFSVQNRRLKLGIPHTTPGTETGSGKTAPRAARIHCHIAKPPRSTA